MNNEVVQKSIKCLFVSDFGDRGGASLQLLDLVVELKKKGCSIVVLVKEKNDTYKALHNMGIKTIEGFYSPFYLSRDTGVLRFAAKLIPRYIQYQYSKYISIKKICKRYNLEDIDIVHTYNNRTDMGALLAKEYNIKHIWHIHEFGELDYSCLSLKKNYITYINQNSDAVLCVSKVVKNYWINKGIEAGKCYFLHNGVNAASKNAKIKKYNGILNVCLVGTICKTKGQEFVIEALNLLPEKYIKKIKVTFIGPGKCEYKTYLKAKVKKYGLNKTVTFNNFISDIVSVLPKFNAGIVCSKSKAFGRVTVEYMMSKLLVLASNTGANKELIVNGETGLLFEREKPLYLTELLIQVIDNFEYMQRIINNGYIFSTSNFSNELYANKVYEFYERLMEGVELNAYK